MNRNLRKVSLKTLFISSLLTYHVLESEEKEPFHINYTLNVPDASKDWFHEHHGTLFITIIPSDRDAGDISIPSASTREDLELDETREFELSKESGRVSFDSIPDDAHIVAGVTLHFGPHQMYSVVYRRAIAPEEILPSLRSASIDLTLHKSPIYLDVSRVRAEIPIGATSNKKYAWNLEVKQNDFVHYHTFTGDEPFDKMPVNTFCLQNGKGKLTLRIRPVRNFNESRIVEFSKSVDLDFSDPNFENLIPFSMDDFDFSKSR